MTTEWRPDFDPAYLYFITTTAVQRLPLFQRDTTKRLIVDALEDNFKSFWGKGSPKSTMPPTVS